MDKWKWIKLNNLVSEENSTLIALFQFSAPMMVITVSSRFKAGSEIVA